MLWRLRESGLKILRDTLIDMEWIGNIEACVIRTVEIVGFRALPCVMYSIYSKELPTAMRLCWITSFLAIIAGGIALSDTYIDIIVKTLLVYCYLIVISLITYFGILPRVRSNTINKESLLVISSTLFVILPTRLTDDISLKIVIAILGLDIVLSLYSYCIETARYKGKPTISDYFLFVFVNPVLVYTERGHQTGYPRSDYRGAIRSIAGIATYISGFMLLRAIEAVDPTVSDGTISTKIVKHLLFGVGYCTAFYWTHSALASLQIGYMRLLGWKIPERYNYAFLARNPADFWRRWNIYTVSWFKRYVFLPTALAISRRYPLYKKHGNTIAILLTFVVLGMYHDIVPLLMEGKIVIVYTAMFLFNAVAMLAWSGISRFGRKSIGEKRYPMFRFAIIGSSKTYLLMNLVGMAIIDKFLHNAI